MPCNYKEDITVPPSNDVNASPANVKLFKIYMYLYMQHT